MLLSVAWPPLPHAVTFQGCVWAAAGTHAHWSGCLRLGKPRAPRALLGSRSTAVRACGRLSLHNTVVSSLGGVSADTPALHSSPSANSSSSSSWGQLGSTAPSLTLASHLFHTCSNVLSHSSCQSCKPLHSHPVPHTSIALLCCIKCEASVPCFITHVVWPDQLAFMVYHSFPWHLPLRGHAALLQGRT